MPIPRYRPKRSHRQPLEKKRTESSYVRFTAGLDTETPIWEVNPGSVQASLNYEMGVEDGYIDVAGYERFDGRKSPSSESFFTLGVQLTESLQSFHEFGGDNPNRKIVGRTITSFGDHVREYPIEGQQSLNLAFQPAPHLLFSAEPIVGVVGNDSTRPFGYTDATVEFSNNFVSFFTDTAASSLRVFFDYVLLNAGTWVLETKAAGAEWVEQARLYHWAISGNDPAGTENIDSNNEKFSTIAAGGWRRLEVMVPTATTNVRLRPVAAGTIALCCVLSRIRNNAANAIVSKVIGSEIVDEEGLSYRLIIANSNGEWTGRERIFLEGAPGEEITRIKENHVIEREGSNLEKLALFQAKAANAIRNKIQKVPGSRKILGLWMLGDTVYVARNNEANTQQDIYKSTANGWEQVPLGYEAVWTGGAEFFQDGDELTIGAETVTIQRVVQQDGSFDSDDASGRIITATAIPAGEGMVDGTKVADFQASTAIVLAPFTEDHEVHYETVRANFGPGLRVYGIDGRNNAFEFDGEVYVPIETKFTADMPSHVVAFQNHLFLSFKNAVQHSSTGDPYVWNIPDGALQLNTQGDITALQVEPGESDSGTLAIFNRDRIFILYGTSRDDWHLTPYREEVGAYARSVQEVTDTVFLDDRGLRTLQTVQAYGNFQHATISEHCRSFLQEEDRFGEHNIVGSCLLRQKNQYRCFFRDGFGLAVTFRQHKLVGIMPINFSLDVSFVYSSEDADGMERSFLGAANGFVYEMERGTSFDGEPINCFLQSQFHFPGQNSIGKTKRFLNASMEVRGTNFAKLEVTGVLDYNKFQEFNRPRFTEVVSDVRSFWDRAVWDQFYWDGRVLGEARIDLHGIGENIAFFIRKRSDYMTPMQLSGYRIRFMPGREKR